MATVVTAAPIGVPKGVWAEMTEAARSLQLQASDSGLDAVIALRRVSAFSGTCLGLWLVDLWTDVFEPVMRRQVGGWAHVQPPSHQGTCLRGFSETDPTSGDRTVDELPIPEHVVDPVRLSPSLPSETPERYRSDTAYLRTPS